MLVAFVEAELVSPTPPAAGTPAWYIRENALPGNRWHVRCIISNLHDDAEIFDGPVDDAGGFQQWEVDLDASGNLRIAMNPVLLGGAASMWFVAVEELEAPEPAVSLVAFDNDLRPPGTVVSNAEFFTMPVRSEDQAAAVRWYLDGAVDQVFVAPDWRRKGVGSALLFSADCYHQARGFPGALRSDGHRTAMGETFTASLRFPDRMAPLSEMAPPMDPPDGAEAD